MTQPAGRAFGVHNLEASFVLRSSPIHCACDAFHFLISLIIEAILHRSLNGGISSAVSNRFRNVSVERGTSLAKLQSNRIYRVGIFMVAALPQFIKLLGCQGVGWTLTCASLYLASFLVLEMSVYLSPTEGLEATTDAVSGEAEDPNTPCGRDWGLYLSHIAGVGSTFMSIYLLTIASYHIIEVVVQHLWPYLSALATFGLATIFSIISPKNETLSKFETSLEGPLTILLVLSLGVFPPLLAKAQSARSTWDMWGYIVTMGLLAIGLSGGTLYWYLNFAWKKRRMYGESGRYVWFLLLNLLAGLLYYAFVYDPTGTVKPAWTDQLG